ncbi:MAG: cupin domain-containing protein [Solirubrobacteraceae bacterium]
MLEGSTVAGPTIAEAAASLSLAPLWTVYKNIMGNEPAPSCAAALWRYRDVRPLLARAGAEVSTQEAERRVLLLRNPGLEKPFATHTLGCGLQLLRGGEVEGSHRHTPAALRFVLEGEGAYTTTDGERIWMTPGDLITTPSWTWHDHGKTNDGDMIWLDGIDVPLINHLGLNFTEYMAGDRQQAPDVADGASTYRYGSGLLPISHGRRRPYSPIYSYPYARTREALERLRAESIWDPCHGLKLRYSNPLDGGDIMPTLAAFMQLLPEGFETTPYRSTDATIFCVVEGAGSARVGNEEFVLSHHDVLVVPNWTRHVFRADEDLVLFSYSDRAMQQRLSLWSEQRGDEVRRPTDGS